MNKRNTLWLCDMVRQTSLAKSAARAVVGTAAAAFPRDVCLHILHNHYIFLLYAARTSLMTRATFETAKYPRRPWDQYTAPNNKCIGADPPHTPQKRKKKSYSQPAEVKKIVTLWNSLVTCRLAQYLSDVTGNCQVCQLWLFCWHRSFAMWICTNIHGSVAFPVLLSIVIKNPHHYWTVVCR